MRRAPVMTIFISILLSMFISPVVSAFGTPDGLPPPMEHICDGESGAAYGLCNAYCQAMDCDSDAPSASANACQKVADKFTQFTGRPVPCSESCPMYQNDNFPTFNELVSNPGSITSCTYGWNGVPVSLVACSDDQNLVCNPLLGGSSPNWGAVWQSGNTLTGADDISSTFLDADEFDSCKGLLEDAIALSGVVCEQQ